MQGIISSSYLLKTWFCHNIFYTDLSGCTECFTHIFVSKPRCDPCAQLSCWAEQTTQQSSYVKSIDLKLFTGWYRYIYIYKRSYLPSTQEGLFRVVPATFPGRQEHFTVCDLSSIRFLLQHLCAAITSHVPPSGRKRKKKGKKKKRQYWLSD